MELIPLKCRRLQVGCNLIEELQNALTKNREWFKEGDILIVASKVVSYAERRLVYLRRIADFERLRRLEAERVFGKGEMVMTLKNKMLIPNAGIDFSNAPKGQVVLWPKNSFQSARTLRLAFSAKGGSASGGKLRRFGIIITDSALRPLRHGTTGVAIGWAGFFGVQDLRGTRDLFGKKMKYSQISLADNLAAAAEVVMGTSNASIPFVIARSVKVKFTNRKCGPKDYWIRPEKCLYHFV